ncbi:uncharacterized protein LOC121419185 [Lytechinus variegatus]|uniref:uncharacterized protein LOC121419185 n=1 Tax=Lytechinus variegatus TaxID=7654 RepID=UPI001BB10D30|nr:uncharacterized protein LOC121419185 [Lytechinus variegatus]XP_041469471.1 uncharacterized protein LOC121419185 [Lytechinus variegatus]
MAGGSYRIDMKRDDPRTLMIKMDARLTFAGQARNHAFRLEAERELRHLDYARHLTRSTLERQQKEMHKRMDFLKNLVEQNRARRKSMEEEEDGDNGGNGRESVAERRKRKEDGLRHTLPIIPARRNLEDLVKSLQTKQNSNSNLSKSLGYLSESHSRHSTQETLSEKRLRHLKQEMRNSKKKEIPKVQVTLDADRPAESPKIVWANAEGVASVSEKNKTNGGVPTQTISLPDISPGNNRTPSKHTSGGRRVSLSQMIATGEIQKLPGIGPGTSGLTSEGAQQNINMARTFYMNTSHTSGRGPILQPIQNQQQKTNRNKRGWVKLPPNMDALKFKEEDMEKNPFITDDFKPETYRSRELMDSNKPEEMYVWLGFDSEEEYRQMVKEAKEELDAESEDGGDDLVELEVIDEVEEPADDSIEKAGAEYLRKRRTSRRVSRLSAPVAMLASTLSRVSLNRKKSNSDKSKPSSALKRFIKAAKTICIVRQFQMNNDESQAR